MRHLTEYGKPPLFFQDGPCLKIACQIQTIEHFETKVITCFENEV